MVRNRVDEVPLLLSLLLLSIFVLVLSLVRVPRCRRRPQRLCECPEQYSARKYGTVRSP